MPFWKCFSCMRFQNEEIILKLDYSNCALTDVPPDVSQHERTLEELYLSSNRINTLSPQLFYCQGIRVLFVNDNELESLPCAIGSLKQLQNLNLCRNGLSTVPDNIKSCKNLTKLDLSLNNLQRLPDAITSLISLQELLLNETNLEFLPANFGRLVNLRILELRSNNLITLPKSMSRLKNLNRIDIGANEFTELPEVICQLSQLRELWIDVNRIRRIPPSVSNLRELKHFEANNNLLSTLPNEISNWRNLEVLSVSTNDMESLPFSIGMLKSLVTLQCEANQLRELPDSICHLENLEELAISHNFILRLPSTIGMLRKLRFFCADENILRSIPSEISSCLNLAVLSVRSNKITELPQNIGHLENLHVLNLVDNYITYLPVSVLSFTKLTALWISDNQSQPLVPLQYLNVSNKTQLTCFMLPQQGGSRHNTTQSVEYSDNASTNSWLNQQDQGKCNENIDFNQRAQKIYFSDENNDATLTELDNAKITQSDNIYHMNRESVADATFEVKNDPIISPSRRICFADEVKGAETLATRLMRSPTPYPKELRLMAKYVRSNHQNQMQQQQGQYVENMVTGQTIHLSSNPTATDQADGNSFLSTKSSLTTTPVDGVKEARVLLNPSGSAVLLQQMQNTKSYHMTDRSRCVNKDLREPEKQASAVSNHQNVQYVNEQQMYTANINVINMLNEQNNVIYPPHQQLSQLSLSMEDNGERYSPTGYVNKALNSEAQQQYYRHTRNSTHQSVSNVGSNYPDQGYPISPSTFDQPMRDILYDSPGSVRQISVSPSIVSNYSHQGSKMPTNIYTGQISKPPPYHIARAFTKKSREDLLNYDTVRNQLHYNNTIESTADIEDIFETCNQIPVEDGKEDGKSKKNIDIEFDTFDRFDSNSVMDNSKCSRGLNDNEFNSIDYQNNNSSHLNCSYAIDCKSGVIKSQSMISLQGGENTFNIDESPDSDKKKEPSQWNGTLNVEMGNNDDENDKQLQINMKRLRFSPGSNSNTTWLFGLHKNPTVKQVAIKRDHEIGFEIQERPNQGIYVRGTQPNTSAATLLHTNDKLLEVDGYDFTKICLVDAQQILDNSGPVINVMISRT